MKSHTYRKSLLIGLGALALAFAGQAQPVLNVISWNLDNTGTINPTDVAGLVPVTNWNNSWPANPTIGLLDNSGAATTFDLGYGSFNTWRVRSSHPGLDADGTANRELLNGYLNAGPAGWNPPTTNTFVSFTNIPYAQYDVVVYFNSDASGRHASISDGTTAYHFSTMGSLAVPTGSANAVFRPTSETNTTLFPSADFAFFPGLTTSTRRFTSFPLSGNDQWLGIAGFQVIESSNVYVLYGAAPANQTVLLGTGSPAKPANFMAIAGGLNPKYQWRHAGVPISNATNSTYTIASPVLGQEGLYDVVVSNSFSSVTSSVATLTLYTAKNLRWAGTGATWDTNSANWTTNSGATFSAYTEADHVRFDPFGIAQPTVALSSTLNPSSIVVSNAAYMLTGGGIAGAGSLDVVNNGTLILDTTDTRSGPTTIAGGSVLQVGNAAAAGGLGSGALTNNGGLVFNIAGDEAYGYPVYGTGNFTNLGPSGQITLSSDIRANYFTMAGGGSILLQGNNSFSGGMVVSSGFVLARSLGALGASAVRIEGGELQLFFGFNYVGSSLTLAGGVLHAGVGGSQIFQGPVTLAADSQINIDGGNSLTLSNSINGGAFNLTLAGGTLILDGANNTWASVSINSGTLQIGTGGANGSLGSGPITDSGMLALNTAATLTVTNPITGVGAINQHGSGIVTLTADNNAAGFSGPITVTNGTLRINGSAGAGGVTVLGGALGGTGTIEGPVNVQAGGTLAPGASIGTLTISSDLSIAGNVEVEVNKSLAQSNDVVSVSGTLANTGTGVVTVNNLGPALAVGNSFKLFSQPVTGGAAMSVSGAGVVWTNKLEVDGSIQVLSAISQPRIVSTTVSGANLVFSGTNGFAGSAYQVLSSTNVATPLASWTQVGSGNFDGSGNFSVTNAINANEPQRYFLLRLP